MSVLKTISRLFRYPFSGPFDNLGPAVVAWGKKTQPESGLEPQDRASK